MMFRLEGSAVETRDFLPSDATVAAIRQEIAALEAERVSARRQLIWRVPVFVGLVLVAVLALAWSFNRFADPNEQWASTPHVFLYVVGAVGALLAYMAAIRPVQKLRESFRARLLPVIFGFIENVGYSRGVAPGSFERLPRDAVGPFSDEVFDDVVTGTYAGFAFELYEAHLTTKVAGTRSTSFRGVIVAFETQTAFPGVLIATRKGNQVVSFFGGLFGGSPLEPIPSGNARLDAHYDFRTDNPAAAKPLVEGRLARALQWLGEAWPDEPARVALNEHNGFLLLPTSKDFFELPGIGVPLDYKAHVEPIITDMASLLATASLVRKIGDADEPEAAT